MVFVHPDGRREAVAGHAGETVLDCALDHGVAGIKGQCGGACICVTCHCYVDTRWFQTVPAAQPDELEMLEYALKRQRNSRLACQVVMTDALDGLVVWIAARPS